MNRLWQRLSRRERGLVFVTLAILVAALARYLVIAPYVERRDWVKNQLEVQPQLLEKNMRFVAQQEHLLAALDAVQKEIKLKEPKLLSGTTASVSASDLQETVQGLATKEGAQVITTRVLNPESAGSFSKIGIQLEIGGQIDQIANLIRGIDSSPKLLVVDEINVRSLFRPAGVPQPQGVPQVAIQNLRVSLTVAGFVRAESAGAGKNEPAGAAKPAPSKTQKP
jgi:Tfp pilus assembly protein PilO